MISDKAYDTLVELSHELYEEMNSREEELNKVHKDSRQLIPYLLTRVLVNNPPHNATSYIRLVNTVAEAAFLGGYFLATKPDLFAKFGELAASDEG